MRGCVVYRAPVVVAAPVVVVQKVIVAEFIPVFVPTYAVGYAPPAPVVQQTAAVAPHAAGKAPCETELKDLRATIGVWRNELIAAAA